MKAFFVLLFGITAACTTEEGKKGKKENTPS